MRNETGSSKTTGIQRGALESAGLGEIAYFLKKARQQLEHARFTLENIDFTRSAEMVASSQSRIDAINNLMIEMRVDLEKAEQAALLQVEEAEEESEN